MLEHHDILCFASSSYFAASWLNVQQIMSRFAGSNRVLYVESVGLRGARIRARGDLSRIIGRARRFLSGLRSPQPGLTVLSPFAFPFRRTPRVERWNRSLLIRQVRGAVAHLHFENPILWTFLPLAPELLRAFPHKLLVYHCVDHYAANPGADAAQVEAAERRLLARADLVFTTSRPLHEAKSALNANTHYVPNVADVSLFDPATPPHPSLEKLVPRPRIGYVGNIVQYKLDLDLLGRLAAARENWSFILLGPVGMGDPTTSVDALRARPNVFFLGEVPRTEVPAYVAALDVCIMPLRFSDYTRHSFPMKFHEFLAMGKPVVSSDVEPLSEFRDLFYPCRTQDDFERAIACALEEKGDVAGARIEAARRNSWTQRMKDISAAVEAALAGKTEGP